MFDLYLRFFKFFLKKPAELLKRKEILLLSHMRGNTSVLSHIIGSSEEVDGYYELHVNYNRKFSYFKKVFKYYIDHEYISRNKFIFDKVLHDHHLSKEPIPKMEKVIIMVRDPSETIRSITKLYSNKVGYHPLQEEKNAKEYYIKRLSSLESLSKNYCFYYIESEKLLSNPDQVLEHLSNLLELNTPLTRYYKQSVLTGVAGAGDSSENMKSGVLNPRNVTEIEKLDDDDYLVECERLTSLIKSRSVNDRFKDME